MKNLKRKTQAEKEGESTIETMTVADAMKLSGKDYVTSWHCENCEILYEEDDDIIVKFHRGEREFLCPQKGKLGFPCKKNLLTAGDDYWEKEYHVSPF